MMTESDNKREEAISYISKATRLLTESLNPDINGSDKYSVEYEEKLHESILALFKIRKDLQ